MLWIADHWDDVVSDMSAIHRKDEDQIDAMTPRQFWPLAIRLVHYQGAVHDVALTEYRKAQDSSGAGAQRVSDPSVPTGQTQTAELIDPTPAQIKALRDAARRKRFPPEKFGDAEYVSAEQVVKEAGRG